MSLSNQIAVGAQWLSLRALTDTIGRGEGKRSNACWAASNQLQRAPKATLERQDVSGIADRTRPYVKCILPCVSPPLTGRMNSEQPASSHFQEPASVTSASLPVQGLNTGCVRSQYRTCPVMSAYPCLSEYGTRLVSMSDASGHPVTSMFQLLFFTNFFSFANVPTPPNVHNHVYVC
jgi:hypothetical protein